jgi:hypothetical protein
MRGRAEVAPRLYIEYAGGPLRAPNTRVWAQWMLTANRMIAKTRLPRRRVMVSTVFLGIDESPDAEPPMLYETCVFTTVDSSWAEHRIRYATRDTALAGHERLVCDITASWQFDMTSGAASLEEWNTAVEALLAEMERHGELEETG